MLSQSRVEELNTLFANELSGAVPNTESRRWDCILSETVIGKYLIIQMSSARMIKSEGYLMNNCCRDYTNQCGKLQYCVFSVRSIRGKRIATLGIANNLGHWIFDQCYGPSNTNVLEETYEYLDENEMIQMDWRQTELYYVAHEVVRLMNKKANNIRE